jgi:putative tryptophan/tyrosine transport system substrate-binding protein
MSRKLLNCLLITLVSVTANWAEAQQAAKIPRIGYLAGASRSGNTVRREAFLQGLRQLGYEEGKNIFIEYRYAEGKFDRLPALAAELVQLKVDLIVTVGTASTRPANDATRTIPIVMAQDSDPVGNGFVTSLARPGGNITGLSQMAPDLAGKELELLKEVLPKLSRVAVLGTSNSASNAQALREMEAPAKALGITVEYQDVRNATDIEAALAAAIKARAEAVLVLTSAVINTNRAQLFGFVVKNQLPAIYPQSDYVEAGGLMFYGPNVTEMFRRAATYVDKILKGAKPADLPVEQPMKFELIVNLKAAKQIGLTIPPNVLARADKVIR